MSTIDRLTVVLMLDSWFGFIWLLRQARLVFVFSALSATFLWPNLAHAFGGLSLGIVCHVGYRASLLKFDALLQRALES